MPKSPCEHCGGVYAWQWEDAFNKFGFNDGDGQVETETVAMVLSRAGYKVDWQRWGLHNTIITSIQQNGLELIPERANVGYDDPRAYLPAPVVAVLDQRLPAEGEAQI